MDFYRIFASSYRLTNIFSSKNIKKILLFVLIGVILFLVFSNSAFATDDEVELSYIDHASNSGGKISSSESNIRVYYFSTSNYNLYTITNNSGGRLFVSYCADTPTIGSDTTYITGIDSGDSYSFIGTGNYILYNADASQFNNVSVVTSYVNGYGEAVDNFTEQLNLFNLWNQFSFAVPLIGVAVLFALGFFIVRKVTKGESKAKVKF